MDAATLFFFFCLLCLHFIPGAGSSVEGREFGRRVLGSVEPAFRVVLLGIGSPDLGGAAHGPGGPLEELALADLDTIGQDVILDTDLHVAGHTWVETQGFVQAGLGVFHLFGGLVRWHVVAEDSVDLFAQLDYNILVGSRAVHQVEHP